MKIERIDEPNMVNLTGYLGTKPEIKVLSNGSKMARVRLATNEYYYTVSGKMKKETQWHNIIAWGINAETFEKYMDKGSMITMSGKIRTRSLINENGEKFTVSEIEVVKFFVVRNKLRA